MNPSTKKDTHVLALDDSSPMPDMDTVMATAAFYRVTAEQAKADPARLRNALATWQTKAKQLGLSAEDRAEREDCIQA